MLGKIRINLFFIFVAILLVGANQVVFASPRKAVGFCGTIAFENPPCKVTHDSSSVTPPNGANDKWTVRRVIYFDNGLYAVRKASYEDKAEADKETEMVVPQNVIITHFGGPLFSLEDSEKHPGQNQSYTPLVKLYVDSKHPFQLPHIESLVEKKIVLTRGPFAGHPAYLYVIKLSDGTTWEGIERERWYHWNWEVGEDEIICVGSNYRPVFINKTRVLMKEHHKVTFHNVLQVHPEGWLGL